VKTSTLVCPSEYSVWLIDRRASPPEAILSGIGCSFRVPVSPEPRRYWFGRNHFAVRRSLGCVVFPDEVPWAPFSIQKTLSSSFAFLQSIPQPYLANRPQPASSSLGLLLPTAHEESKVHRLRVCQPATFRLQGLITLLTAYSLRSRAGFLSHRQRSWDSPFGAFSSRKVVTGVFHPAGPTYR
jgi:hypothetical protein